jgi:hypothetical protein
MNPTGLLIYDLLKTILTIGLVLGACMILLRFYLSHSKKSVSPQAVNEEQKIILPLRLQAYERLVLFLERIHPNNLILRLNRPDLSATQLQSQLVKTVREEFEYNLSQQLYISSKSWEMIKNAKEETINSIHQAASKIGENESSAELVRVLFEQFLDKEKLPVERALDELKREIQQSF